MLKLFVGYLTIEETTGFIWKLRRWAQHSIEKNDCTVKEIREKVSWEYGPDALEG